MNCFLHDRLIEELKGCCFFGTYSFILTVDGNFGYAHHKRTTIIKYHLRSTGSSVSVVHIYFMCTLSFYLIRSMRYPEETDRVYGYALLPAVLNLQGIIY